MIQRNCVFNQLWALLRRCSNVVVDIFFVCVLIIYNIIGYAIVIWVINHYDLHPVPAVVLNVEQV